MKKVIKSVIYMLIAVSDIILITLFLRMTFRAYNEGLLLTFQFYPRLFFGILIYFFLFLFILMLLFEYTMRRAHSIWWEAISLIILFIALMANIL